MATVKISAEAMKIVSAEAAHKEIPKDEAATALILVAGGRLAASRKYSKKSRKKGKKRVSAKRSGVFSKKSRSAKTKAKKSAKKNAKAKGARKAAAKAKPRTRKAKPASTNGAVETTTQEATAEA